MKQCDATVVGGGLAGLTAALALTERGCAVRLLEASDRLGGKAGAIRSGADHSDHGYHVFPAWYLNIWRLVDELGLRDRFIDCQDFVHLRPGSFPKLITFYDLTSPVALLRNLTAGLLPPEEILLFYFSSLDLAGQPYRYRSFLDRISVSGFIRSRFYRTESLALAHQEFILKGLSVPSYELSAMTLRKVIQMWLRNARPMYRILDGNMQERFIQPIEERLLKLGCAIGTGQRVERVEVSGRRVTALHVRDVATGRVHVEDPGEVVVAIPHGRLAELVDDDLYAAAPQLAKVRYLRSRVMAAFDVHLERSVEGLPRYHVNCLDSRYGLSFIDVSQSWPGQPATVLQVIASDFTPLLGLSAAAAEAELLADLRRFLPGLESENIAKTVFQPHVEEPLFANDVGAWAFRPEATTQLENLYLAGDYCRSEVDIVCQEGAVITGLTAAEAVRRRLEIEEPVEILSAPVPPRVLLQAAALALLPAAAGAKAVSVLRSIVDAITPP